MMDRDELDEVLTDMKYDAAKMAECIRARLQAPENLPKIGTDEDFERMTEEAGLDQEILVDIDGKAWRQQINTRRQDIDRVNTSIKQIMRFTNTELTSALVRRQSFVIERRLVDKNCKAYDFLPHDVWHQFGFFCSKRDVFYDREEACKKQLTDQKGADRVAIRFDDPHFMSYAAHFEDQVNCLRSQFNGYNHFMQSETAQDLTAIIQRLPAAIRTTFQLYYIKLEIDIDYAKSRQISDWGEIGQDYGGEDLAARTTNLEVYQEYPRTYYYGSQQRKVYNYLDYLNTKEWEYQKSLRESGGKDDWALKQLFASNSDEDVLQQFFLLDRLIQDFEYHEQYDYEKTDT